MNGRLAHDLARWEAGDLAVDEVARRHPGIDIVALTGLHARLSHLTEAPSPDPAVAWAAASTRIGAGSPSARARRFRRPAVIAVLAAVLAVPTVSYAAAPDAVRSTLHRVTHLFPSDNPKVAPGDGDGQVPVTAPAAHPEPLTGDDEPASPESGTTTGDDGRTGADTPTETQGDGSDDTGGTPPLTVEADADGAASEPAVDPTPAPATIAPEIDAPATPADS